MARAWPEVRAPTRGQGPVWFESPASTKGGGTQAFLSDCPNAGNNGMGEGRRLKRPESSIKKRSQTPYYML